jgi:hypothetical protein
MMSRVGLVFLVTLWLAAAGPAGADQVFEGWDEGHAGGWQPNTSRTAIEVYSEGGVGNTGYLRSYEVQGGFNIVGAVQRNAPYVGDYGAYGYGRMEVAIQFFAGSFEAAVFRVRYLDGSHNGWYRPLTDNFAPGEWHMTGIDFDPSWSDAEATAAGWVQESNSASFQETMANVYTCEVRAWGTGEMDIGLDVFWLRPGSSSGTDEPAFVRGSFALHPSAPCLSRRGTVIVFDLAEPCDVRLCVFDVSGRQVAALASGWFPAGRHTVGWNGQGLTGEAVQTGICFCSLEAGRYAQTQKVLIAR